MKDHEIAELVNKLTSVAREFHSHRQLRSRISRLVVEAVSKPQDRQEPPLILPG